MDTFKTIALIKALTDLGGGSGGDEVLSSAILNGGLGYNITTTLDGCPAVLEFSENEHSTEYIEYYSTEGCPFGEIVAGKTYQVTIDKTEYEPVIADSYGTIIYDPDNPKWNIVYSDGEGYGACNIPSSFGVGQHTIDIKEVEQKKINPVYLDDMYDAVFKITDNGSKQTLELVKGDFDSLWAKGYTNQQPLNFYIQVVTDLSRYTFYGDIKISSDYGDYMSFRCNNYADESNKVRIIVNWNSDSRPSIAYYYMGW